MNDLETPAQLTPSAAPTVHRRNETLTPETTAALSPFAVATIHEAYHRRGLLRGLVALDPELAVCGPAVTALCHAGDNLMLHAAIDVCQPGDVLVVATLAPSDHGMFGDLLATLCQARGIAGLVIDAGVRDTRTIRAAGFPVWSRTVSAAGTTKAVAGWVNVPVVCGGGIVNPGDVVCADADGVVIVGAADAEAVAAAAADRERRESEIRTRYAAGIGKDIHDLLVTAGVTIDLPPGAHLPHTLPSPHDAIRAQEK